MKKKYGFLALGVSFLFSNAVFAASSGDIVFNEIAWAGSSAHADDEWIELRNTTNADISLKTFRIYSGTSASPMITFGINDRIPANGFYLIRDNGTSYSSALQIAPDKTTNITLNNTNFSLTLFDGTRTSGVLIDSAGDGAIPLKGVNTISPAIYRATMHRMPIPGDGTIASNWFTSQDSRNLSNPTLNKGTPGNSTSSFADAFNEVVYEDGDGDASKWIAYDSIPTAPTIGHIASGGCWKLRTDNYCRRSYAGILFSKLYT